VLRMLADGDPEAWDLLPEQPNLSGQWADDHTPASVQATVLDMNAVGAMSWAEVAELEDALSTAWEEGVSEAFQEACEEALRAVLPEEDGR
jgi:enoyl-CoA hydratase/carnithine racemase